MSHLYPNVVPNYAIIASDEDGGGAVGHNDFI